MKVFKFGGASVKDAEGIRNLAKMFLKKSDNLVIVVSAFGKTTNALEKVLKAWIDEDMIINLILMTFINATHSVISELFGTISVMHAERLIFPLPDLNEYLSSEKRTDYDFEYDQVVSYGEIWSTIIVAEYLIKTWF